MRALFFTVLCLTLGCGDDDAGDGGFVDESRCVPERCNGVDDDCDGVIDDGFAFADDPTNCGACGVNCRVQNGAGVCSEASCQRRVLSCDPFYGDCDGDGSNGCEGDFLSNDHCGACNAPCARDHASTSCAAGECELLSCREGFGNCDEDDANGCEVALETTEAHCGACTNACAMGETCTAGSCVAI